ncbi:hypothetical protein TRVL_07554 [Trypanosoma vivax]|nr:hypothetical protein TRVL_07554 [Trypanosoma vivax]
MHPVCTPLEAAREVSPSPRYKSNLLVVPAPPPLIDPHAASRCAEAASLLLILRLIPLGTYDGKGEGRSQGCRSLFESNQEYRKHSKSSLGHGCTWQEKKKVIAIATVLNTSVRISKRDATQLQ